VRWLRQNPGDMPPHDLECDQWYFPTILVIGHLASLQLQSLLLIYISRARLLPTQHQLFPPSQKVSFSETSICRQQPVSRTAQVCVNREDQFSLNKEAPRAETPWSSRTTNPERAP
jgi:hypothetical protein